MYRPLSVASVPSESVAPASLRTSAPPSEIECDEKFVLRPSFACRVATWKRRRRFDRDLVVIHHRAVAGHDLGHRVGEVRARADVAFDDGALGIRADHDQRPRMRYARPVADRQVDDVDRLLDHRSASHPDERAVIQERGVQRGERILDHVPAQVLRGGIVQIAGLHALRQAFRLSHQCAVDEHETDSGRPGRQRVHIDRSRCGGRKGRPRDRRDVGEAPLFVVRGRETQLREPAEARVAQRLKERGLLARRTRRASFRSVR